MKNTKKGFTLLELLIVIGILAILATVAILIINPAELLRRSRDSARISDLNTLKSAIGLYLTDMRIPDLDSNNVICSTTTGARSTLTISSLPLTGGTSLPSPSCAATANANVRYATSATYTATDGTGWIPINFNAMSTKSPLASLPIDPTNACGSTAASRLFYTYSCNNADLTFLLTGRLESSYYAPLNTPFGIMNNDGGVASSVYEVGTSFTIYNTGNPDVQTYGIL